ncbi:winged helix-turn-helix domain-containing protein [Streptomyces graminilatus]|uniref:GntR family transcriptional regulator n=1 Tax=Streptomyces graminilatus TaxID=1464070 RepID=UPI001F528093|nr:winged helix-turn-helix domain-containing protein [Streptomyces graminilatus]
MEEKINPAAASYHYEQLAKIIENKIRTGEFAAGSRLPGEMILSQEYGVGSNTVRRALDILRERGLLVTVRARGSFVVEQLPGIDNGQDEQ